MFVCECIYNKVIQMEYRHLNKKHLGQYFEKFDVDPIWKGLYW